MLNNIFPFYISKVGSDTAINVKHDTVDELRGFGRKE